MSKSKFPQFKSFACIGDSISWQKDGFDITATLHPDPDSHVNDSDCYSATKVKQWMNDEWFFVGVVLAVSKDDVLITEHAASLWGIECNYNKNGNKYLAQIAQELESEALEATRERIEHMIEVLAS